MSTDWEREQASWVVTAGAEPPEDWLATTIRSALRSSAGNAEPSSAIWGQIRQSIASIDLLREAEQEWLIQAVVFREPGNWRLHRKIVNWIGIQMVKWGRKLQRYGTVPSLCYPSC